MSTYTANLKLIQHFFLSADFLTLSVPKVTCQGDDLDLIFLNQAITVKEIRLHSKFQVNATFCSEDINDFGFQGHMSRS